MASDPVSIVAYPLASAPEGGDEPRQPGGPPGRDVAVGLARDRDSPGPAGPVLLDARHVEEGRTAPRGPIGSPSNHPRGDRPLSRPGCDGRGKTGAAGSAFPIDRGDRVGLGEPSSGLCPGGHGCDVTPGPRLTRDGGKGN